MTVTAYDAAYPTNMIPKDGGFYLSYTDFFPYQKEFGKSSFAAMNELFPGKVVSITGEVADRSCLVADCEPGALTPQVTADWAFDRVHAGQPAVIYSDENENTVRSVALALKGRGLEFADPAEWPKPGVYWWAANWSAGPNIPHSAIGVQYASVADYDTSVFRVNLLDTTPAPEPVKFVDVSLPLLTSALANEERESVRSLQVVLNSRKTVLPNATADLVLTAKYDTETSTIVTEWQKLFHLPENGECDATTWAVILDGTPPK